MKKVFILDTNILLSDPNSIFKFEENDVVIPISVIEEIDHFKKDQSEKGRNAREVSRILDRLRKTGALSSGVKLFPEDSDSGLLSVHLAQGLESLPGLLADKTDNQILATALTLHKKLGHERDVLLITKDSNLRIKSDAFGIASEDFEADKVDISHLYTGIKTVRVPKVAIEEFTRKGTLTLAKMGLHPNEFVVLEEEGQENRSEYGIYHQESQQIKALSFRTEEVWGIFPRNLEQTFGLWALLDDRIKLVTLSGGAGTGKTLLAIAAGLLKTTDEDLYQKLLVARPIFALGKDIGFLPGDLEEKLNPWMQPIFDSLDFLMGGGAPHAPKTHQQNLSRADPSRSFGCGAHYVYSGAISAQFFLCGG